VQSLYEIEGYRFIRICSIAAHLTTERLLVGAVVAMDEVTPITCLRTVGGIDFGKG
jgi:hypothetical protein